MKKLLGLVILAALSVACASGKPAVPLKIEACELRFHGLNANVGFLTTLQYELETDVQGKVVKITPAIKEQPGRDVFNYDGMVACIKGWRLTPGSTYTLNMDLTNMQPVVWDLRLDGKLVLSLSRNDLCNRPIPPTERHYGPPPPHEEMPNQKR